MARDGRSSFASRVFELGRQVSEKVDIEKARAEAVDDLLGYSPETIECALAKVAMEEVNARILSASVQMQSGELEGAITEFLAAFDIYESQPVLQSREFCTKHSNVGAACLGGIGLAWRIIGSLEFALKFFRAAVSEQERVFGDALEREHLEAIVLYKKNIGEILEELGETDNAQLEYQECLSSTVGGDKRDASDLVDTGGLRVKLGDLDGALKAFMEALAICESENRDQDLQAAQIHLEVARVLEQKGDFAGSLQSFEKALTIKRILYGEEHSEVATIYIDIGSLQESHDRHDDALASFGKSLDVMEAPKYADYPQLACAVAHKRIGFLLEKQGDLEAAAKSFAIASSINQKLGRISIDGDGVGSSDVPTACALEQSRPPCTHYERNCTMIAPCCGAAFGCRICHDECPNLPPKMELQSACYKES
ncbi:repeat-containing protein [Seminavis robusta]|uniref:Repeat-containing protein n=1 Tax=Seminavis robusta TaxID=568900 RepID=A0A9N8D5F8_9STRA|nr:repeat-containing protein [Seminavis robusta]|eukprot:Sro9_g007130.1 repeat-containing protein (426) ;mRNA; f:57863-59140